MKKTSTQSWGIFYQITKTPLQQPNLKRTTQKKQTKQRNEPYHGPFKRRQVTTTFLPIQPSIRAEAPKAPSPRSLIFS